MLRKSAYFIAGIALVFAMVVFTTCGGSTGGGGSGGGSSVVVDAEVPVIITQPANTTLSVGGAGSLTVAVSPVEDGGTLSYQWYSATDPEYGEGGGTAIPGAKTVTYTIDSAAEGIFRFYVKITNTGPSGAIPATVNSSLAIVTINDPANAQYPNITAGPAGDAYIKDDPIDELSVTAAVSDSGVLSYQWYSSAAYSNTGGTRIDGAVEATYQPELAEAGTYYFYVVVTNKKEDADGRKESAVSSSPAAIKILAANATITVNTATKLQYVRGFGVMAPFWGNAPQDSVKDYETMYNPVSGLGYNMLRIMIPVDSVDIRVTMDKALGNQLSGSKDRRHYYEIVKLVNNYNGFVLASPWTPPAAWKTNNSTTGGGKLKTEHYLEYADYLKDYCEIMGENGAPIYAVSIQNEPNYRANYDGCEWDGSDMRDFFIRAGIFTEGVPGYGGGEATDRVLTMFGESANSPTDSNAGLNDPIAKGYIDLYARHLYGTPQVTISTAVHAQGKEVWMTEYNVNGGNADTYPLDSTYNHMWKFLNTIDCVIRLNKENGFIWWYGKRFYSQIGDGEYGTVNGVILPRGWALSHYAKYAINTDQVSLSFSGTDASGGTMSVGGNFNNTKYNLDDTAVRATAFLSKDGKSISLVLFTPTNDKGASGKNMGSIKIKFPDDFNATKVTAMRTKEGSFGKSDTDTILLNGGNAALIKLPAAQILSVKFTK